tara:strand:+ start:216 stop:626 length:411 start_codon:yes stop_codon:yes gene_type:complete
MLKITERQRCPKDIKDDFTSSPAAPQAFIDWHRKLAEDELTALCSFSGAKVHNQWLQEDGWFDGFKSLHAIIETQAEKLIKIKWNDGNQCFMRRGAHLGWYTMSPEDFDNQEFTNLINTQADSKKIENIQYKGTFD